MGFSIPFEHGFTVIWLFSVFLAVGLLLKVGVNWLGLLITLPFAFFTVFSNNAIATTLKSRLKTIVWQPFIILGFSILTVVVWRPRLELFLVLALLGLFFIVWSLVTAKNKGRSTLELGLGSVMLGLTTPLIFQGGLVSTKLDFDLTIWILGVWWVFSGVNVQLILHVQKIRKIITTQAIALSWIAFVLTTIPLFLLQILHPLVALALVEPTIYVLNQLRVRNEIPENRPSFKIVGRTLTIRLALCSIILMVVA